MRTIFTLCLTVTALQLSVAQSILTVQIPAQTLYADQLLEGDGDLYGLGSWQISVTAQFIDTEIFLQAEIIFSEDANDRTTIIGKKEWFVSTGNQRHENFRIMLPAHGLVSGKNIGARGTRTWQGNGLIEKVNICTDTFGADTGKVGGTLIFSPLQLVFDPSPVKILPILFN